LHYHRYEPTPYLALEFLFNEYILKAHDTIVDFGCGKGRLNFYINYIFNANVVGVEMNSEFYIEALANKNSYLENFKNRADKIKFTNCFAEEYKIGKLENKFYFFNPFSVQIFMKVIHNIMASTEEFAREVDVILYYPSEDYIYYLDTQTPFEMIQEINLPDRNPDERFLIYRLSF
jgi:SAM-dependent methyltransferase